MQPLVKRKRQALLKQRAMATQLVQARLSEIHSQ
jgi:hypothetical protein